MKTILPIEIVPIENDGYHLKIEIIINGKLASMILDTGASRTVFDEGSIAGFVDSEKIEDQERLSTGLGTNSMESKKVMIEELEIGGIKITNYNAAVLDLSHINQSYKNLEIATVDGVLGGDILTDYKAVIDYEKKGLILKD